MLLYLLLGCAVGCFGSLIGVGGGFILTPILLIFYPALTPSEVTAISITTVMFNSASGSAAYAMMGRIDYKTGLIFSAAALPGTIIGTMLIPFLPKAEFDIIFGASMIVFSAMIIIKSRLGDRSSPPDLAGRFRITRRLRDKSGREAAFSFNMGAGVLISLGVGFLSGILGIGGGIVHVPALVLLGFPAHFAAATSHFVLALTALSSFAVHAASGSFIGIWEMTAFIALGALIGAQAGARLSSRIKGRMIMLLLAAALVLAGIRILYSGIVGVL
ncbi:MAG: sulfite exporter TauE/SafE family protein [Clostridia bacterium]|nr:sulfite exporter TauE/SafE family protein [Clostridia bacterium]